MSAIAKIKTAVFDLPPPGAVGIIEQLDERRDALMVSKRTLELLDKQEDEDRNQWLRD